MDALQAAARKAAEEVFAKHEDAKLLRIHVTPGPKATPEGVAAAVKDAIERLLAGDYEDIEDEFPECRRHQTPASDIIARYA